MNNNNLKDSVKYYITLVIMNCLKIFWICPLQKDTILFHSFGGKQYSDSPKYLSEYIRKTYLGKKIIWVLNDGNCADNLQIDIVVKPKSMAYFYYFCTSGTIITNDSVNSFLPVRRKQIVLNTWHGGGPLKTVGFMEKNQNPYNRYFFKIQNRKYTTFLSSSTFFSKSIIGDSFHYSGEILNSGMPWCDILFSQHEDVVKKVYASIGLQRNENIGIVLYAPTFRGSVNDASFLKAEDMLNIEECIYHLEKKFHKRYYFLFRAHHSMDENCFGCNSISVTNYPDMQELLCAADVLITDYSSCMHDFALMRKPVFLYIPDYENYMIERGMYWDIFSLPFPYAMTTAEFAEVISNFDFQKYRLQVDAYLHKLGNFESGTSILRSCAWLEKKWKEQ